MTTERPHRVCPWWLGYLLASPLRRILIPPAKVLAGHVRAGMTVLEPGPGMGFFTLAFYMVHELPAAAASVRRSRAALLEKVLIGEGVDLPALIAGQITGRPVYEAYAGERMTTQINFDNEASDTRTLIEIQTEDRLGLLYAISQTFSEQALDIARARIVTERGAAIDSFYVRELDGGKIVSPERRVLIENRLREAIKQLATEP